jgi:hypothetical protein
MSGKERDKGRKVNYLAIQKSIVLDIVIGVIFGIILWLLMESILLLIGTVSTIIQERNFITIWNEITLVSILMLALALYFLRSREAGLSKHVGEQKEKGREVIIKILKKRYYTDVAGRTNRLKKRIVRNIIVRTLRRMIFLIVFMWLGALKTINDGLIYLVAKGGRESLILNLSDKILSKGFEEGCTAYKQERGAYYLAKITDISSYVGSNSLEVLEEKLRSYFESYSKVQESTIKVDEIAQYVLISLGIVIAMYFSYKLIMAVVGVGTYYDALENQLGRLRQQLMQAYPEPTCSPICQPPALVRMVDGLKRQEANVVAEMKQIEPYAVWGIPIGIPNLRKTALPYPNVRLPYMGVGLPDLSLPIFGIAASGVATLGGFKVLVSRATTSAVSGGLVYVAVKSGFSPVISPEVLVKMLGIDMSTTVSTVISTGYYGISGLIEGLELINIEAKVNEIRGSIIEDLLKMMDFEKAKIK